VVNNNRHCTVSCSILEQQSVHSDVTRDNQACVAAAHFTPNGSYKYAERAVLVGFS